jgi:glycosyltransferase involved in cell wall biosynthesis
MHILLIHQAFATLDEPGGTRHHELVRYLASRGHRVTVIASPISYLTGKQTAVAKSSGEGEVELVTILRPYTYPAWHRSFLHRIFSFLSFMISSFICGMGLRGIDLVWGTSPPIFQGGTAWLLARLKGARFLFEVRDLWPAFAVAIGVLRSPLLIRPAEWFEHFLYKHADQVVVNSPGFIDYVKRRGARRVALVPNGADPDMFDPTARGFEFRQRHHLEGRYVVLYAGAHGLSNDLGVVLQVADMLREQTEIAIVLLGDGKEKPHLVAQAAEMRLSNIHFLAPIPKNQMPQALAAADACLAILKPIPLYKTVYPNKVFDYMAAGRPVILAIDGVIRKVVETAQAGVFVSPGNPVELVKAIQLLAGDLPKGRSLGLNGRHYMEKYFNRASLAAEMERVVIGAMEPLVPSTPDTPQTLSSNDK